MTADALETAQWHMLDICNMHEINSAGFVGHVIHVIRFECGNDVVASHTCGPGLTLPWMVATNLGNLMLSVLLAFLPTNLSPI